MSKKLETIRRALNSKGIVITAGIAEQIESNLSEQGYKIKKKKHNKIVNDYDKQKEKHLERLATKMLDNDEKLNKLKGKNINTDFLNLF
jgi:hypothetical protein